MTVVRAFPSLLRNQRKQATEEGRDAWTHQGLAKEECCEEEGRPPN